MMRSTVRSTVRPTSFDPAIVCRLAITRAADLLLTDPRLQGRAPRRLTAAVDGASPASAMSLPTRSP
jgi:hypothetical protein